MTEEEAIRFTDSKWYEGRTAEEITALQLYEERLCVPEFKIFHEAIETALKRPIQTLEFVPVGTLQKEFEISIPNAQSLQRLTKGNMINNKKMDCQPYRKRRPAVKRAAFLRDRERRKTYKETGPK